ncbi:unnamed protein product [Somion occarium]|uniref:Calcineurin-like phosphoesterase domain-containing protein n=1 Tax=Somion occarium TaxID=3059160 RepID=A0ABP1EAU7_9APHY
MTRYTRAFVVLVPLVATFLVFRTFVVDLEFLQVVAAKLNLSWPLAVHPDALQKPLAAEDASQWPIGHDTDDSPPSNTPHDSHHPSKGRPYHGQSKFPPTPRYTRKIVAVGDLHGDMPNARSVLQMAGVVDRQGNWTGDVDIFVQTGDIIDRGDDTIKLYFWMEQLRSQAEANGGIVLSHLGNHEWMNVIGDWRYVHPSEIKTFGSVDSRFKMLTKGRIGKAWATNYTTTSRLPLHPSLGPPNTDYDPSSTSTLSHAAISFVHGGLAPHYPDLTPFPSRINDLGHSLLRKLQHRTPPPVHPPHPYPGLPMDATPEERRLYAENGPLWYRGWALKPEEKVCREVDDVLEKTGTRRMVMGHTPDFQKIVSRCGGKIIIIDTGISHAYGGALSALSIQYTLTPISITPTKKLWIERELVSAVYPNRVEILADVEAEVEGDFA